MRKKLPLTRPELKRRRDALDRFERYLPTLKLKEQQLQLASAQALAKLSAAQQATSQAEEAFRPNRGLLRDVSGTNVESLAEPTKVRTKPVNIAGIKVPAFEAVDFSPPSYSLFATPAWVDSALAALREISRRQAEVEIFTKQYELLHRELTKVLQRVNLFEKVKIPECRQAIRTIRIRLGDEMTAAVARAKIAKNKLTKSETDVYVPAADQQDQESHNA